MNYTAMPGFGDPATWGGRSPEPEARYSGPLSFQMTIGLAGARVTVLAETNGYELEDITAVMLEIIDILPALDVQVHEDIRTYYERHAEAINRKASDDALEGSL